jgi:CheY-like chemotaxis protein
LENIMSQYALVVDDVRVAAATIAEALRLLGYETQLAYGSRQAIESLAQRMPDVILLDINMPGIDGVEVCRYLRRDPLTAEVPIIAMSSESQAETIAQVRKAGANAFLPKPIDIDALERTLKKVLGDHRHPRARS